MRTSDQVVSPLHSVCLASGGCIGSRSVMDLHQGPEGLRRGESKLRWALSSRRSIVDDVDAGAARWSTYRQAPLPSRPELLAALVRLCQDDAAPRREESAAGARLQGGGGGPASSSSSEKAGLVLKATAGGPK
jgi:hypothetical protein